MDTEKELIARSENACELCGAGENLSVYQVKPFQEASVEHCGWLCSTCISQLDNPETADPNHWRCLTSSIWSEFSPIKVLSWRMLTQLSKEGWAQDLLESMYLTEEELEWAKQGLSIADESAVHRDSNGNVLQNGDSVVLIKDLDVKGANFTAKRGTAVRNINLVADNPEHIEGKVNGQQIVILTKYVKK